MNEKYLKDLHDYEIEKPLGEGTYGKVWTIREKKTNNIYAAKISLTQCTTFEQQKTLIREITAFSIAENPAILKFIGYSLTDFDDNFYPTIITEYMPSGSLEKMITDDKYLTSSQKYIILLGIAEGMKFLHSINVIHRDLKPSNILIDDNFYPKICDFGESKLSETNLMSELFITQRGSPISMAPEILSDEPYTYKIDIFSFSLIMYQLITGKPLYNQQFKNPIQLSEAILNGLRPDLQYIEDENIKQYLSNCWDANPEVRPTFDEIVEELKTEKYKKMFKANESDVLNYLKLFKNEKNNTMKTKVNNNESSSIEPNKRKVSFEKTVNNNKSNFENKNQVKNQSKSSDNESKNTVIPHKQMINRQQVSESRREQNSHDKKQPNQSTKIVKQTKMIPQQKKASVLSSKSATTARSSSKKTSNSNLAIKRKTPIQAPPKKEQSSLSAEKTKTTGIKSPRETNVQVSTMQKQTSPRKMPVTTSPRKMPVYKPAEKVEPADVTSSRKKQASQFSGKCETAVRSSSGQNKAPTKFVKQNQSKISTQSNRQDQPNKKEITKKYITKAIESNRKMPHE